MSRENSKKRKQNSELEGRHSPDSIDSDSDLNSDLDLDSDSDSGGEEEPAFETEATAKLKDFMKKFKQPKPAANATKERKIVTTAKRGSRRKHGSRKTDVKGKTLAKRPSQFPGQGFKVTGGQLYCCCCKKNIGSGMQRVKEHVESDQHKQQLEEWNKSNHKAKRLKLSIIEWNAEVAREGEQVTGSVTAPEDVQLFRAETLREFIQAGVDVGKIDRLRSHLECKAGMCLTGSNHLMEMYMGPLKKEERDLIREEVADQDVSVAHDGTTHEGEAFAVTLKWLTDDVEFKSCALRAHLLEASLNNEEISRTLITDISQHGQIPLTNVVDINNDSASPNGASHNNTASVVMLYADLDPCIPHTGNNAGDKLEDSCPTLGDFMKDYTIAVGKSKQARTEFRRITGMSLKTKGSSIRWWAGNDAVEECM